MAEGYPLINQSKEKKRMQNRVKVLDGEVKPDKKIVAESTCKITFPESEKENLLKCIEEIRKSGERNSQKEITSYDWQDTCMEATSDGSVITFGVAWYDKDFFEEKKDVYLNPLHIRQFEKFGKSPESVTVTHRYI